MKILSERFMALLLSFLLVVPSVFPQDFIGIRSRPQTIEMDCFADQAVVPSLVFEPITAIQKKLSAKWKKIGSAQKPTNENDVLNYLQGISFGAKIALGMGVTLTAALISPSWGALTAAVLGTALFQNADGAFPFTKLQVIPKSISDGFMPYGLKARDIRVLRLKGSLSPEQIFLGSDVDFAVQASIAQALGSILYAGEGKGIKEVADGNAVFMGEQVLKSHTATHPKFAVVILGDEGSRDDSFSLDVMSVYFEGEKIKFEDLPSLKMYLEQLKTQDVRIMGFVGDALEVTNGLTISSAGEEMKEPTNSWSMFSLFDDIYVNGAYIPFVSDDSRLAGISYEAPEDAGVNPLDLPEVAIPKIAKAHARAAAREKGIVFGTDQYAEFERAFIVEFFKHTDALMLGPRPSSQKKENESIIHRHQMIIDSALKMEKEYTGFQTILPTDGDCVPRILSAFGIPADGRHRITFGRTGSAEATIAALAADLSPTGYFPRQFVSAGATNARLSSETADPGNFTKGEIEEQFTRFGIPELVYTKALGKQNRRGIIAVSSVTGASSTIFGNILSHLMRRITFKKASDRPALGTVRVNTLLITRDGSAFAVRTTLNSDDLEESKHMLKMASPAAHEYHQTTAQTTPPAQTARAFLLAA